MVLPRWVGTGRDINAESWDNMGHGREDNEPSSFSPASLLVGLEMMISRHMGGVLQSDR